VNVALAAQDQGPKGADMGLLTIQTAWVVHFWQLVDDWSQLEATAAREGRQPSITEMPGGEAPPVPKNESDRIAFPDYVFNVSVDGDHATAMRAFLDPKEAIGDWLPSYPGYIVRYVFTKVDNNWFISGETRIQWPFDGVKVVDPSTP